MADQIKHTRQVNEDGSASIRTTEVIDNTDHHARTSSVAARVVWLIASIIVALLAFRFVFILLGANSANGFANLVYGASYPFAAPFFGLFNYTETLGQARFELSTLVAIAVYLLIATAISSLLTIRQPRHA